MSGPSCGVDKARALVAAMWRDMAAHLRVVCRGWPCRNSAEHIAVAQFQLEVERARRASEEKGGRA